MSKIINLTEKYKIKYKLDFDKWYDKKVLTDKHDMPYPMIFRAYSILNMFEKRIATDGKSHQYKLKSEPVYSDYHQKNSVMKISMKTEVAKYKRITNETPVEKLRFIKNRRLICI